MAIGMLLETHDCPLTPDEERYIRQHLERLGDRLVEPLATVVLTRHERQRQIDVALRVELAPPGEQLISHQVAGSAPRAVRLAVADVQRQLDHRLAGQPGEPAWRRRMPRARRAHSPESPAC